MRSRLTEVIYQNKKNERLVGVGGCWSSWDERTEKWKIADYVEDECVVGEIEEGTTNMVPKSSTNKAL